MENISPYLYTGFIAVTLYSVFFFWKAFQYSKIIIGVVIGWLLLQSLLGTFGFYTNFTSTLPRFMFAVLPPMICIAVLMIKNNRLITTADPRSLVLLHAVRIGVELCLYELFIAKTIPEDMTFAGRNFDILSGISAPFIYYFGFVKQKLNRRVLITWNVVCIGLLLNVVIPAVLSAPYSFQQMNFDQPNVAVLYMPFIWLPAFIVPAVLFAHLISIKNLLTRKQVLHLSAA